MVSFKSLKKSLIVGVAMLAIAACAQEAAVKSQFENVRDTADVALAEMEPRHQVRPALTVEDRSWFGSRAVRLQNGQPLPDELNTEDSLVMTFDRPMDMHDLARQIQSITGLRVVVPPRQPTTGSAAASRSTSESENLFLPTDGIEVAGGRILWQGRLRDLLNQVSDYFDSEWSHRNGVIYMNAAVSRTFTLYALAGSLSVSGAVQSGSSGGAGNLPTQSVGSDMTLSIWEEVENAINAMMGGKGSATFSPSTGTITVNSSPSVVQKVEEYLRQVNKMRLRRIAVVVRVLSVDVNSEYDYAFDLQAVLERALRNQPFYYSSTSAGGLAAGIVRNFPVGIGGAPDLRRPSPSTGEDGDTVDPLDQTGQTDSAQAVIRALASAGRVSIVHTGAVVTLSDQPAPLQIARQQTYVARVSAAASGDSSSTSLEPGTVEEGLTLNILPRVIEKDRVLLRVGMGITQIRQIRQLEAGDGLRIELPDLDTTGFLQNIVLSSGETLVMTGFERDRSNLNNQGTGVPNNFLMGGRRQFSSARNVTVLMMSSEILPEDPFGVHRR